MQGIIDWIRKYSYWLVFLLLEGISLFLLLSYNNYQNSVWFACTNSVVGQIQEWRQGAASYLSLGRVNSELSNRNIVLEQELEVLRRELNDLRHDSSYTERMLAAKLQRVQTLSAKVVYNSISLRDNYITINKGTADGVETKMGVVCGTGLVGIVSSVSEHYSIVMSVLNSRSRISCRLRGSDYFGYLHWQGGNALTAILDDIPRHADFQLGDIVETSGFSNVFPPGIFVGRIIRINDSKDGLSYQLIVQLSSDLANIHDVSVILREHDADTAP